jgi:DNA-binding LytR/AlgR family response regulator
MNILICDDIHDEALELEKAISGIEAHSNFVCTIFTRGADALSHIQSGAKTDVCFLDILMPEMKGTELAYKMREAGFTGEIVFLTSTNEYASESYTVNAFSYLLKPPKMVNVAQVLAKIQKKRESADTAGIPIASKSLKRFLLFREISHVEVLRNDVHFRLLDGSEIAVRAPLSEFLPKLMEDRRFTQCHRSFVLNMDAVASINGMEVLMRCGRKVPVSKKYTEFANHYFNWAFGKKITPSPQEQ